MKKLWSSRVALTAAVLAATSNCKRPTGSSTTGSPASPPPPAITSEPHRSRLPPGEATPLFEELSPGLTGVSFVNEIVRDHPMQHLYSSAMVAGGVAISDIDGNGTPDLFFVGGPASNALYLQSAPTDLQFTDVTATAGIGGGDRWGVGAAIIDIDNDGDQDIYVCNYDSPNQLFLNRGGVPPTFEERAEAFHLAHIDASHTPAFCDYDRDGDLDLYLLTNAYTYPDGTAKNIAGVSPDSSPGKLETRSDATGRPDRLFRNDVVTRPPNGGEATFKDVTYASGLSNGGESGLSATWWDFNDDGFPDLHVANGSGDPDHLYMNNGDGSFIDLAKPALPHTTRFSMGADFADVNGDGSEDLLVADMSGTSHFKRKTGMGTMTGIGGTAANLEPPQYMRNTLYLNTRRGKFQEAAYLAGLAHSDWTWAVKLRDFDNDGWPDVFFSNGMSRNFNDPDIGEAIELRQGETKWDYHVRTGTPVLKEQNLTFRNLGDLQFENVTSTWLPAQKTMSFSTAAADLDRDGDIDLVVANLDEPASILRNNSSSGSAVTIRLKGTRSHTSGLGARVTATTPDGREQMRHLTLMRGYLGGDEPLIHIGTGLETSVATLAVRWPSGHTQTFENLATDHLHTITEPDSTPQRPPAPPQEYLPYFVEFPLPGEATHRERPFDDFAAQPLLPNKLSQTGPPTVVGDVDNDGDDDFYLGGAAGQPGQVFLNSGNGQFLPAPQTAFADHSEREDIGALFFEADGDGDLDLYVVSGGVEHDHGSLHFLDRLYLNDGAGGLSQAPANTLPKFPDSGSCVTAADFDHDGDLDLFVGGRVQPRRYPFAPANRLLRNDGGTFIEVTSKVAPELAFTGMVTAALWSDIDANGWIDLLVAHEWGPVRVFKNRGGRLEDATPEDIPSGWWNSISARDIDGDGDIDYLLGNSGLNSKYQAAPDTPAILYAGDMDGTGQLRLIEGVFENDTLYPVRGRSCSTSAIPSLYNKFTSYRSFASATLPEIYQPSTLERAHRSVATELGSGLLINGKNGSLSFRRLPRLAQLSPIFGSVVTELNGDTSPDIILVGNSFAPQTRTGRMDGGIGLVLLGQPGGTFTVLPPHESGFIVPGDAKALALLDADTDGRQDLLIGSNNAPAQLFLAQEKLSDETSIGIVLKGLPGNPAAIGAHVTVTLSNGRSQTAEIASGSGYLSQSSLPLVFGLPQSENASATIVVRWPDEKISNHPAGGQGGKTLHIDHPSLRTVSAR